MGIFDRPTIEAPEPSPGFTSTGINLGAIDRLTKATQVAPSLPEQPSISPPASKTSTSPIYSLADRVASYSDRLKRPRTESSESIDTSSAPPPTFDQSPAPRQGEGNDKISAMMAAIGKAESSGNYGIKGLVIPRTGDRAYGKYQVMGRNLPSWTKEALGVSMTPEDYLRNPAAQDAVARFKMNQYYDKFGTIEDVAAVWLSGKPLKNNRARDQATGITVPEYARRVMGFYKPPSGERVGTPAQDISPRNGGPASRFPNIAQAMFKATGVQTVPFGGRTIYEPGHPAIDLAAKPGTPIRAFAPGVVTSVAGGKKQGDKGYGNYVIVKDPYGNSHRYSHLHDTWVQVGQKIFTGADLGSMGNTGQTYSTSGGTGTHLDYRIADAAGKFLNPTTYLNSINKSI